MLKKERMNTWKFSSVCEQSFRFKGIVREEAASFLTFKCDVLVFEILFSEIKSKFRRYLSKIIKMTAILSIIFQEKM